MHGNLSMGGVLKTPAALYSGMKSSLAVKSPHNFALQPFVLY